MRYYDCNGDAMHDEDEQFCYYECRHPPCSRMERELREFSICGRCQVGGGSRFPGKKIFQRFLFLKYKNSNPFIILYSEIKSF